MLFKLKFVNSILILVLLSVFLTSCDNNQVNPNNEEIPLPGPELDEKSGNNLAAQLFVTPDPYKRYPADGISLGIRLKNYGEKDLEGTVVLFDSSQRVKEINSFFLEGVVEANGYDFNFEDIKTYREVYDEGSSPTFYARVYYEVFEDFSSENFWITSSLADFNSMDECKIDHCSLSNSLGVNSDFGSIKSIDEEIYNYEADPENTVDWIDLSFNLENGDCEILTDNDLLTYLSGGEVSGFGSDEDLIEAYNLNVYLQNTDLDKQGMVCSLDDKNSDENRKAIICAGSILPSKNYADYVKGSLRYGCKLSLSKEVKLSKKEV
jgi:hypothetical protein